jgi:hypothetical protein
MELGEMPDPLDALTVTVRSPDSLIEAEVDSRYRVKLRFRRGSLRNYVEFTLEHQLSQLSRLAWVAYQREHRAAVEASGRIVNDWDPKRREYREALAQIEVTAISDGGYVEAGSVGLERWTCRIQPGALAQLSEDRFAAEAESAVANLITQYQHRVALLKDEYFQFDLPPHIRSEIDRLRARRSAR